jgi:hypothetical protein
MTALAVRQLCFNIAGMKLHLLLVKSLIVAVILGAPGLSRAESEYGPKPTQPPSSPSEEPAKKPGDIPGLVIPRANGGFLGLELDPDSRTFKLSFYDEKKKPIAPDVATAVISWYYHNTGTEKLVYAFGPGGDGKSLASPRVVVPPLPLRATIFLFASANDSNPVESYLNQNLTSVAGN